MTDATVAKLHEVRHRHHGASTDCELREMAEGNALYGRLIPEDDHSKILIFPKDCGYQDMNFYMYAHSDMEFVLKLFDEACTVIRNLRRALDRDPEPKYFARDPKPMNFAAECAMKCKELAFKRYIGEQHGLENWDDEIRVTNRVKSMLSITSRNELNTDEAAAARWKQLRTDFEHWRTRG